MKIVFVWESLEAKKLRQENIVCVHKEECPICHTAGVWFDNQLDMNKCDNCGAVENAGGWCGPPRVSKKGTTLARVLRLLPRVAIR